MGEPLLLRKTEGPGKEGEGKGSTHGVQVGDRGGLETLDHKVYLPSPGGSAELKKSMSLRHSSLFPLGSSWQRW